MKKYVQGFSIFKFFFIFIYIFFSNLTGVLSSETIWDEARKGNKGKFRPYGVDQKVKDEQ